MGGRPTQDPRNLIAALGGPAQVARACNLSPQAVCGWYVAGLPARHHLTLWRLAQSRGVDWKPPQAEGVELRPQRAPSAQRAA